MNTAQRLRARLILAAVCAAAAVIAAALYWIQGVKGKTYAATADRQYEKPSTALFDRGSIFFSEKGGTPVSAAAVATGYLVYMNPSILVNPAQAYEALSHYLTLDRASFMARASRPHDLYEELAHRVGDDEAPSIAGLGIIGIGVAPETWRSYPGGTLAAHALGIIGEDAASSTVTGRYGLERSYESVLARDSVGSASNAIAQMFAGIKNSVFGGSPGEGDIITTIEPTVQSYLESTLVATAAQWKPDEIGGIIIDPKTGEIAAMGSLPTFDPNDLSTVKDTAVLSDPLVEHAYEMGSIMKPLTIVTGLDSGTITPTWTYDDTGTMTLNGKKISNYDGRARGIIPVQQILSQSLNVGAANVALKVGKTIFPAYFKSFGIGEKTGIDEPNETPGLASNLKDPKDIDIATASYGQGIALSPVAMARALSVIASGGYLITPHLVKEIDHLDGTKQIIAPTNSGPILKAQSVEDVTRMLVTVVDAALKNGAIKRDHYSVAAKTGTAQIADHVNGGYYSDRYLHSFFGFFPAYNPKFLIFLYQIYPKGAEYASDTLTVPFDQLVGFLINYYNIPPDR